MDQGEFIQILENKTRLNLILVKAKNKKINEVEANRRK